MNYLLNTQENGVETDMNLASKHRLIYVYIFLVETDKKKVVSYRLLWLLSFS